MVTSFALNDTTLSLTPGSSSRLLPTTPNPSNANLLMATWATSNPNVALVLGDGREMTLCYSEENNVEKAASEPTHPAPSIEGFGKDESM
jgi:hypothetical protein